MKTEFFICKLTGALALSHLLSVGVAIGASGTKTWPSVTFSGPLSSVTVDLYYDHTYGLGIPTGCSRQWANTFGPYAPGFGFSTYAMPISYHSGHTVSDWSVAVPTTTNLTLMCYAEAVRPTPYITHLESIGVARAQTSLNLQGKWYNNVAGSIKLGTIPGTGVPMGGSKSLFCLIDLSSTTGAETTSSSASAQFELDIDGQRFFSLTNQFRSSGGGSMLLDDSGTFRLSAPSSGEAELSSVGSDMNDPSNDFSIFARLVNGQFEASSDLLALPWSYQWDGNGSIVEAVLSADYLPSLGWESPELSVGEHAFTAAGWLGVEDSIVIPEPREAFLGLLGSAVFGLRRFGRRFGRQGK